MAPISVVIDDVMKHCRRESRRILGSANHASRCRRYNLSVLMPPPLSHNTLSLLTEVSIFYWASLVECLLLTSKDIGSREQVYQCLYKVVDTEISSIGIQYTCLHERTSVYIQLVSICIFTCPGIQRSRPTVKCTGKMKFI